MVDSVQYFKKTQSGVTSFFTLIVCNNRDEIILGNQSKIMNSGNILLLKQGIPYVIKKGNCDIFSYEEDFFDHLIYSQLRDCKFIYEFIHSKQDTFEYLFFDLKKNSTAFRSIGQIKDCFKYDDIHTSKLLHLSLISTLTQIERCSNTLVYQNSNLNNSQTFGAIIGYIGANYNHINCRSTALHFGYHPDYFSSFFKKNAGVSFSEKLLEIRIEEAKKYLVTTSLKVEEIIALVGFKERSFFMKKFKEKVGYTPLQYRKKMQQTNQESNDD